MGSGAPVIGVEGLGALGHRETKDRDFLVWDGMPRRWDWRWEERTWTPMLLQAPSTEQEGHNSLPLAPRGAHLEPWRVGGPVVGRGRCAPTFAAVL